MQQVKISKDQFAEGLFYWLTMFLTEKTIKKTAKDIGFRLRNNRDFKKISEELLILNMWLIVHTSELVFADEDKRNDLLDMFHHLVYDERNIFFNISIRKSYKDWMQSIIDRYVEYGEAMETEHPQTPFWVVADVFNKRLFGETQKDLQYQSKVMVYIGLFVKHLGEAIKRYDIE